MTMNIGRYRKQALWRLLAAIWAYTVGAVIAFVVGFVGIIWGIIDVVLELFFNRDALSSSSTPATLLNGAIEWQMEMQMFIFTGKGEFEWLP